MKKHGLLKTLLILIIVIGILSWIIPASYYDGSAIVDIGRYRVGLFDYFQFFFLTYQFQAFIQIFIYILAVGALYGVLSKTGKFRIITEKFAKALKGKEVLFLTLVAFLIAGLTSAFGFTILLFLFMPLLAAIILLLGYDKITAMLVTFGSTIIGIIGGTLGSYTVGIINESLSTTYSTGIYTKIGLFVITFAIYILFTIKYASKIRNNKEINETLVNKIIGESKPIKKPNWPLYLILGILFVIMILGCVNWSSIFGIELFNNFNTKIGEVTIGEHAIFTYILGNISALGNWYYAEMSIMCIIASIILGFIYKLKFNEIIDSMVKGIKETAGSAFLTILAFVCVYICANMPFINNIVNTLVTFVSKHSIVFVSIIASIISLGVIFLIDYILIKKSKLNKKKVIGITLAILAIFAIIYISFNMNFISVLIKNIASIVKSYSIFMTSIAIIIGTVLHVDITYLVYILPIITVTFSSEAINASIALASQGFAGVTMLLAPTSLMIILGLTYLDIPYKKWLKFIWKLALVLYSTVLVVLIVSYYL